MQEKPAVFWKRGIAFVIDSIVISFIISTPFASAITIESNNLLETFQTTLTTEFFLITLIIAILTLTYWSILEWQFQQSVGKVVLKLKVKSIKKQLTFKQALTRNITKISTIILLIDCLNILKKKNQRYFEKISNTKVVMNIE